MTVFTALICTTGKKGNLKSSRKFTYHRSGLAFEISSNIYLIGSENRGHYTIVTLQLMNFRIKVCKWVLGHVNCRG